MYLGLALTYVSNVSCKVGFNGPGVVIVVCSPGYRSSCIAAHNCVSIIICIVVFMDIKKKFSGQLKRFLENAAEL